MRRRFSTSYQNRMLILGGAFLVLCIVVGLADKWGWIDLLPAR